MGRRRAQEPPDLVACLLNSRLKFHLTELAALPRAAVVVEDRY